MWCWVVSTCRPAQGSWCRFGPPSCQRRSVLSTNIDLWARVVASQGDVPARTCPQSHRSWALSSSRSASVCADLMCAMSREPPRGECTVCTARAPDALPCPRVTPQPTR